MALVERVEIGNRHPSRESNIAQLPHLTIINRNLEELSTIKDEFSSSPMNKSVEDTQGHYRRGAIREFRDSYAFSHALHIAYNRVERFNGVDDFSRWFAGNLFSHFAWNEISQSLPSGHVLLPEDYTAEVLREIGGVKTKTNGNGVEMGEKSYLPDGLLLSEDSRVLKMYEYTLSTDYFKFLNQVKGFRFARESLSSVVSKDVELVFVVPSASNDELENFKSAINREMRMSGGEEKFRIHSLNGVTRGEFTGFISRTLKTERAGNMQTLSQLIQEREFNSFNISSQKSRREELSRRIDSMFEGGSDDIEYVVTHASKHEKPIKESKKVTIITLPRRKPPSFGEPEFFRK
jgi:hypothetical protein